METLINVQIGFILNTRLSRPDELTSGLNNQMDSIFDTVPLTLPLPDDPNFDEVPMVQLRSQNGVYSCNISRSRIDFFMTGMGLQQYDDVRATLQQRKDQFLNFLFGSYRAKRIAYIMRYFVEDSQNANSLKRAINTTFTDFIPGTPVQSLINYVAKTPIKDIQVNNYIQLEVNKSRIVGRGDSVTGVLITRDFNTNINESDYSSMINKEFFDELIEYAETNFKLNDIKQLIWPLQTR